MNIENYVNLAKVKNKIPSNNKLGECLGMSGSSVSMFVSGKSTPSPETFIKLCQLAGVDEKEGLLDFLISRYHEYKNTTEILKEIKNLTVNK